MLGLRLCVALIAYPLLAYCCLPDSFQVLDLSHTLSNESLRWPGGSNFSFTILTRGWQNNNSFWLELNKFDTPEHIGTHMDAPAHFYNKGWKVHEIPADRLVGPGVVIDVKDKVFNDSDYRMTPADVESWEKVNGPIPKGAIVFMRSGWDTRYPNKKLTFNTNTPDNESTFHFPGFHPDTARWLIVNRNIGMIGIDTPSTDYGPSPNFEVHQIISNASVMGLENVNNLGALPPKGFIVTVAPVKLFDGSGGPVRILALVSKDGSGMCTTNSAGRLMLFWAFKFGLWHVLSSLWKICIT
ncbi:isatin hydrolase-like isoform X1 [Biomphalaria glabrata]|uniref:Isatin hydrolase-like isoform X1 n=1 Tax=Biomphalaria glabrata TaxID=6526 RepID=A0A9U8EEY3_BIOGL|nr:isatin hydrolase-like isoform X1 [Biomphalaria glabrata]XP_013084562.2 isatin hydrolase-like isoform X1 [Biomphalaria glabrata]XP_013084564.2 isatin hydrolase-like isoform X1 [Biomphalaria glabrata]